MSRTVKKNGPPTVEPVGRAKGQFGKGRDPLERLAGSPSKPEPPARVEVEGAGLLADYRFVWENDKAHDDTPKRKTLRKLLVDDPRGFVKDLKELEKADLLGQAGGGAGKAAAGVSEPGAAMPPPAPDKGTAAARSVIDRLLATASRAAEG